jgi:hypothetical protein
VFLDASKKTVYLRNRRFLKTNYKDHNKLFFRFYDNTLEIEPPPERCHNGEHVYKMVKTVRIVYGKKNPDGTNRDRSTPSIEGIPFKKQSIFFQYLPYWLDLELLLSIDAMHVQKNVFESLIAILLDTGK